MGFKGTSGLKAAQKINSADFNFSEINTLGEAIPKPSGSRSSTI